MCSPNIIFSGWTKDVIDNEIDFAISKIKYAIDNESVWNYLRAIIKHDLLQYEKGTVSLRIFSTVTRSVMGTPGLSWTLTKSLLDTRLECIFSGLFCDRFMGRK